MATDSKLQVSELVKKRGNMKSRITSLSKRIESIDLTNMTDEILLELRDRLPPFQLAFKDYEIVKEAISILIADDDGNVDQNHIDEMQRIDDSYYALLSKLKNAISKAEACRSASCNSAPDIAEPKSTNIVVQQSPHGIKLPTIELPKFKGAYENWLEYRDTFRSLIHTNNAITDMQKFHYLRASLIGDAAHIIKSIEFAEQNYTTAWNLLCSRFDNSSLLIHNHIKALFGIEIVKRESSESLWQLVDNVTKHIGALTMLGQPTDSWDTLIIYLISGKLDTTTAREWESYKKPNIMPTLEDFTTFLKKRADLLETIELTHIHHNAPSNKLNQPVVKSNYNNRGERNVRTLQTQITKCTFCQDEHFVLDCPKLKALPINERMTAVIKVKLCINCLRPRHHVKDCRSSHTCKVCHGRHHSLLHLDREMDKPKSYEKVQESSNSAPIATTSSLQCTLPQACSILPTVIALMTDHHGQQHSVRILLDSGSQANFITADLVSRLGINTTSIDVGVTDFNAGCARINKKCEINIKSRTSDFTLNTTCFVTPQLTGVTPCFKLRNITLPPNLRLADPQFHSDRKLDVLIGTENFFDLLCVGQHSLGSHQPKLQKTRFGWILAGPGHPPHSSRNITCNSAITSIGLQNQLAKFWELEECKRAENESDETNHCETHFLNTHKRTHDGRFVVTIPFKSNVESIGNSYNTALKRFLALERKLEANPDLRIQYNAFMNMYCELGHMTKSLATQASTGSYFLPHHAVINEASTTTKLRVVFDGSARATCGKSINDFQHVGPTIQSDLLSILLRFRERRFVVMADITKMYRQVLVNPTQRKFQQVIWRNHPNESIQTYTLNTVTYGTAAASFLAIRCLHQLANEIQDSSPNISNLIQTSFYVDDLMIGFDSREDAIHCCNEISDTLKGGGFPLRKWKSNDLHILQTLSGNTTHNEHDFGKDGLSKALGLFWSPADDTLTYKIHLTNKQLRVTKRTILSKIASIFDPLGLVTPFTIMAKIFLQGLWKENLNWDESLPSALNTEWLKLNSNLIHLNNVTLPRCALVGTSRIDIHGFCDASKVAYGACIYLVSRQNDKGAISNILCAKSRVAPIKQQSIPRLELCAAVLLGQLYNLVQSAIKSKIHSTTLWSDSTIVLSWLKSEPLNLKPFVRNRVITINSLTRHAMWKHVSTADNPADIASRGINAKDFNKLDLWWYGPSWLSQTEEHWPTSSICSLPLEHEYESELIIQCNTVKIPEDLFNVNRYSSIRRLQNVVAYSFRFIHNLKSKIQTNRKARSLNTLTTEEIEASLLFLVKMEQQRSFSNDIDNLSKQKQVSNTSNLLPLSPFLDEDGILRVGGRLRKSILPYSVKHPIVLPARNHLTKLIFEREHSRMYHVGPLGLLHSIRQKYWPIRGRDLAKQIVNDCIICKRANPHSYQPKMGDLPTHRISQAFPFQHTGVDYAGPFTLKSLRGRGGKLYKAYVALFVCFATRALHLELVTDLSTDAFIACLRRFVARRGKPSHIYSDNGTNFVGAKRTLSEISVFLKGNENKLVGAAASDNISWKFIPARAPNFGGLWEAGVKSVKFHLKRVILDRALTYEDFYTVLVQIEAILNSRPITPMSTDPNDESPLTPAHLLIGRTLNTVPDLNVLELPEMRLNNYQRTQALVQGFWKRWHHDYLNQLQLRSKWKTDAKHKIQVGDLVTINDENLPPLHWRTARIIELHPGEDGIVRVVSLKTSKGIVKRSVNKISPLLASRTEDSSNFNE